MANETGLPIGQHPGAFAVVRKHHIHEGIDLYASAGTPVFAVESGIVVDVRQFTGPEIGHEWWLPTYAVFVEGASGVVVYGEISPVVVVGCIVTVGDVIGTVIPVLKVHKGRPTSMLHLELRLSGCIHDIDWAIDSSTPDGLLDPTKFLPDCVDTWNKT